MKGKNLECHIKCDDEPLLEYRVASNGDEEHPEIKCWIASEVGKRLSVHITRGTGDHDTALNCWLYVDGQRTETLCLTEGARGFSFNGPQVNNHQRRPYIFSSVALTDDNEANQMNSICVRRLGIISLQCHRIKVLDSIVRTSYDPEPVLEDTLVHERRKTLGGHRILLGGYEDMPGSSDVLRVEYLDPKESPYITFTWQYRAADILQAQNIIPSAPKRRMSPAASGPFPSPSKHRRVIKAPMRRNRRPAVASSSRETLNEIDDLEELIARREALDKQRAAVDERLRQVHDGLVKREVSPIFLRSRTPEVIDLTDD
ncbi:hypothetical protein BC629DRAFT_1472199 [Irpex lacteus]|nr:hypothetical protein BC629DRAFT_1472199 [Irpex lacteus]